MGVIATITTAVWAMLPAYLPNNVAVVAGGGRPIDGGRTFRGARLLGDGKTWRGLFSGVVVGIAVAVGLSAVTQDVAGLIGTPLPRFPIAAAVSLPIGAMLGDIGASFVKRRVGRSRGAAVPVLDQLDFAVGAVGLSALVTPAWTTATFTIPVLVAVAVLTPALHLLTNGIGYALGLKREPW